MRYLEHDVRDFSNRRIANQLKLEVLGPKGPFAWDLGFARDDGTLILWEFYSDLDQWEFLEYARVKNP